jgi:RHS repeat-associated protein
MIGASGTDVSGISLPSGGGAQRGIGETFAPDLQTGTGNFTVPLAFPAGRNGFQPKLNLVYSTGQGNGAFGLGWDIGVFGISRKTAKGVPRYRDSEIAPDEWDTFLLSGAEDLVPLPENNHLWFRPRTEGLFARIEWLRRDTSNYWQVRSKDGLISNYGTSTPGAIISDPQNERRIFTWKLSRTEDPFGNSILYDYLTDHDPTSSFRWVQSYLQQIRYADYTDGSDTKYLVSVTFEYEPRPDAFSDFRAGFEIHTRLRCRSITVRTHAGETRTVRTYHLIYEQARLNGISLLKRIELVGSDGLERFPPIEFGYTSFDLEIRHDLRPVTGADAPPASLARAEYALADLTGDGLPDVLEMNGTVRYWRNCGNGCFDRPRMMQEAPAGLALSDPGVQLMDADGDGRADLVVSQGGLVGYYPLRFAGRWDAKSFRPYRPGPTFSLKDPEVALVDLNGDGVPDLIRSGQRLACAFNDAEKGGWTDLHLLSVGAMPGLPSVSFADPRVKWADLSGDGLQDVVLVHNGSVQYWPNMGYGKWARPVTMRRSPRLPWGYNPSCVLLGDIDGDGFADLIYVDNGNVKFWINRSGYEWSDPVEITGTPTVSDTDAVRLVDFLGTGIAGVLWTSDAGSRLPRANMYFLDLTGAAKPYLMSSIDNNIGAKTLIEYRSSTVDYLRDREQPETRWKTPLPFPVQVVGRVEVVDSHSKGKLTTEYLYRHGYWDGFEREFRGFGLVEQLDTEELQSYNAAGLHGGIEFRRIEDSTQFSPPTLTKTWFHLGPVGDEFDGWNELDYSAEFWQGDPPACERHSSISQLLPTYSDRRDRRDALRALRGLIIRTELYARDPSQRRERPYTVTESLYGLREEATPAQSDAGRRRIFFPYLVAQRTTQWERGDDPLTQISFTDAYDHHGQPTAQTAVALPRRAAQRGPVIGAVIGTLPGNKINETRILANHTRTTYAAPIGGLEMHNRVAEVRNLELRQSDMVAEQNEGDLGTVLNDQRNAAQRVHDDFMTALKQWKPGQPLPFSLRLIGHSRNYYDGDAFIGHGVGEVGPYGALTRSEALVFTTDVQDDCLDRAFGERRPQYLGGSATLPPNAPAAFVNDFGYRLKSTSADGYHDGYYADTVCQQLDVQSAGISQKRGTVVASRDALGNETTIEPDPYWLLPSRATNPAGLTITAEYDPTTLLPAKVVDENGHATRYLYTPLGLLRKVVTGRDTPGKPGVEYFYDFAAQPISVRTRQRIWHAKDGRGDDTLETVEYSDGFGRLIQKRVQAEDLVFGDTGDDVGLLVAGNPVPGQTTGPARGRRVPDRVVVSGWQVYDNKGRVVERYEPFFSAGWAFQPESEAKKGRHATLYYDPRGQLLRTVAPDGSEQRTVFGFPSAPGGIGNLDAFLPSPWETYTYDANDLAPLSSDPDGASLAGGAPAGHYFTPTSAITDALGRTVCQIVRNGTDSEQDWFVTRSEYDIRGNVVAIWDALGREAFKYAYDLRNRSLRVDSIDAGLRTSVPDAADNLIEYRDSKGALVLREYDNLNRLITVWARDDDTGRFTQREKLSYGDGDNGSPDPSANLLGRLYRHYDEAGVLEYARYDFKGNVREKRRRVISDAAIASGWIADWAANDAEDNIDNISYRTDTIYDALNRPVEIVYPRQSAGSIGHRAKLTSRYNRGGVIERLELDGVPYIRQLAYNAKGQRVLAVHGNGVITRYAYDPDTFRLVRLRSEQASDPTPVNDEWAGQGQPLQELTYRYDLTGNIVEIQDRTPGCGVAGSLHGRNRLVRRFEYDPLYRLTKATGRACRDIGISRPLDDSPRCGSYTSPYQPGAPVPDQRNAPDLTEAYTETYAYDPAGNMLKLKCKPASASGWKRRFGIGGHVTDDWRDAGNNRLTSLSQGTETHTYQYDNNGNLTRQDTERTHSWNHADRMTGFRNQPVVGARPSVEARYLYGADGQRVKKWVRSNGSSAESTVYIDNIFEHHRWKKTGRPAKQNHSLHVMDGESRVTLIQRGHAHEDNAGPPIQYRLADHLGSSAIVVDDGGAWINREEYFPYGETTFGSYSQKRYRFTGKERDQESALAYHGARYYAPWLSRWVACDPGGTVNGENLYTYVMSNPLNFIDATGRQLTGHDLFLPPEFYGLQKDPKPTPVLWSQKSEALEPKISDRPQRHVLGIAINISGTKASDVVDLSRPGHTVVYVKDPKGKVTTLSFGPTKKVEENSAEFLSGTLPAKADYPIHKGDRYNVYEWHISELQFDKALTYIQGTTKSPGSYTMHNNCTLIPIEAGHEAEIDLPSGWGKTSGHPWLPGYRPETYTPYHLDKGLKSKGLVPAEVGTEYFENYLPIQSPKAAHPVTNQR